ncbi:MAG TPA: cytochrome c3 family protein [Kofleriaceae bacterium]|nr:cytochrome c3 family protein [Kofleriaceae bacterium]
MTRRRSLRVLLAALAIAGAFAACASVLGLRHDRSPAFPHRAHVVRGISCPTCHQGIAEAGTDGPLHFPSDATCTQAGCHTQPHDTHACLGCHADPVAAGAVLEARDHLRFEHKQHVDGPANGNCARCHVGVATGDTPLRPPMAVCWGCHEHERVRDVRDCNACHRNLETEDSPPASHLVHDGDFATRHGEQASSAADLCSTCHQQKFCAQCHGVTAPTIPARLRPADPFAPSVHRPAFIARHGEEARVSPSTCTTCHQPSTCGTCHQERGVSAVDTTAGSPHPPGWIGLGPDENEHGRAARRDPVSCASCHGGAGEAMCATCHRVGGPGGNPHPAGWTSDRPLNGPPCLLCHTGLTR